MKRKPLLVVPRLTSQVLRKLFEDETCLVVVHGFAAPITCRRMARFLTVNGKPQRYTHEIVEKGRTKYVYLGVDRVGVPFNSTYSKTRSREASNEYYSHALSGIRRIRNAASPYLSPMDHLRLELDDVWPAGAYLASFEGKKMFMGIGRLMNPEFSTAAQDTPHFDALPKRYGGLDGQFAANVFLMMPDQGGELEVWDEPPIRGEPANEYGRSELPPPIVFKPAVGDLVLFDSRKLHSTRAFSKTARLSLQCFIGLRKNLPLVLWS